MGLDYIFEGSPPKSVPQFPATGLDNGENIFYVSSKHSGWVPIGGGVSGGSIIQAKLQVTDATVGQTLTNTATATTLYAVSLYLSTKGTGPAGGIVATLTWTDPDPTVGVQSVSITLPGNAVGVVVETYPILALAGTAITLSTAYASTAFPYSMSARLVAMP